MFAIKDLSTQDLELIREHMIRRELERNEILFSGGTDGQSMYFVETGSLKTVFRPATDGGDDTVMSVIKPGGFCGEEVILREGALYESTAVALETTVILELPRANMQKIMASSMTTATKLLLGISRNLREAISVPQQYGKIVAFISPKDGSGRTTIATHLARHLVKSGKKVIFIDCDFQLGDAHVHLRVPGQPNLARLIQMEERLSFERIQKYFQSPAGLSFLAAPHQPQEAELVNRSSLNQIIQECMRNCDFLVLDIQSHIDEQSILLWDIADLLVLVTRGDLAMLTRTTRLMSAINRLNYPKEKLLCVLNSFTLSQQDYLEQYQKVIPNKWFTVAENETLFANALTEGLPIWQEDAETPASKDLQAFSRSFLGEQPAPKGRGGIFSRIKALFSN